MKWRRWIRVLHRDIGYFFTGVVILYGISGLAVNHVDDWNPNFVIERREVTLDLPAERSQIQKQDILRSLERIQGVGRYRSYDFPSERKVKVYLDDGSILIRLSDGVGVYETIRRRPLLYEVNFLHLNPRGWWRIFADVFALALIVIAVTGLVVLRGKDGITGRGKWLVGTGLLLPLLSMLYLAG